MEPGPRVTEYSGENSYGIELFYGTIINLVAEKRGVLVSFRVFEFGLSLERIFHKVWLQLRRLQPNWVILKKPTQINLKMELRSAQVWFYWRNTESHPYCIVTAFEIRVGDPNGLIRHGSIVFRFIVIREIAQNRQTRSGVNVWQGTRDANLLNLSFGIENKKILQVLWNKQTQDDHHYAIILLWPGELWRQ